MKKRRWTRARRVVQLAVAMFYVVLPIAHLFDVRAVAGTLASLRVGPIDLTEPASAIAGALASRTFTWTMILGIAPVVALALVLGPVFCSWVCPWGLISEGIDRVRRRISKKRLHALQTSRWPRFVVLAALVGASVAASLPLVALLSVPRAITALPLEVLYLRMISPLTAIVLFALLAIELFAPRRIWCRILCPVGTTAVLLRTPKTATIRWEESRCLCPRVAPCEASCAWGVDPRSRRTLDACTNCMACVEICPQEALALR